MMRCFLLLFSPCVLLFSCSEEKQSLPAGVLPVDSMTTLVWDLELAGQSASDQFILQRDSLRMESTALYEQVFTRHKVKKENFYNSFSYYEARPALMKRLLDSVSSYGNRQRQDIYKEAQ